jgi:hypothetical protein
VRALPVLHTRAAHTLLAGACIAGGMLAYLFMENGDSGAEHKVTYPDDQLWWYNLF